MPNKFSPQNKVQTLAYERKGITTVQEFEKAMGAKPWRVARTTARYWWENGTPTTASLNALQSLSDFFDVSIDDLVN